jgi:hypothetical protein
LRSGIGRALGKPLSASQEIRQVLRLHPALVDREDVAAVLRLQQEVGVLHALGDALERQRRPQVVAFQEGREFLVGDVGIDGHGAGMRERALAVKGELVLDVLWSC